jgi:4a-hydroxytetrahydrobiopterin dehydratase
MKLSSKNSPIHHTQKIKARMRQLIEHLREDVGKVAEPKAQALFETSAEVLTRKRAQTILRTFKFEGFLKGIDFVYRIARKAQKINHHPDIDIRFDRVTLKLTTHDEGGITEKDFSLARQCDEVFAKCSGS